MFRPDCQRVNFSPLPIAAKPGVSPQRIRLRDFPTLKKRKAPHHFGAGPCDFVGRLSHKSPHRPSSLACLLRCESTIINKPQEGHGMVVYDHARGLACSLRLVTNDIIEVNSSVLLLILPHSSVPVNYSNTSKSCLYCQLCVNGPVYIDNPNTIDRWDMGYLNNVALIMRFLLGMMLSNGCLALICF